MIIAFMIVNIVTLLLLWIAFAHHVIRDHRIPSKPLDMCSCKHTWAFHRENGKCQWTSVSHPYSCSCVRFDGIPPAHIALKEMGL